MAGEFDLVRLRAEGRGKHYGVARGLLESTLRVAYLGDWPRGLWARVPGACRVRQVHQQIAILPRGAAPRRVAFASDLHLGPTTPPKLLDAAFAALCAVRPDVLLLGGDYVFLDATARVVAELEARVAAVPALLKVAVLGNHDLWTRHDRLERALERAGVHVLVNAAMINPMSLGFSIVGLDDPWTGELDMAQAFSAVEDTASTVVLCHSPDALNEVARVAPRGSTLYVCGHTHGGHIATPWGPIVVPGPMGKQYPAGRFHVAGIELYVSRGIGGVEVPMRSFAPPEVAVFDLVGK